MSLKVLYSDLLKEMKSSLLVGRHNIRHAPTKGDVTEQKWKEWLENYLPRRYRVEKAFIIDINGTLSDQIDLVIFDGQYSPLLLKHQGALYVPAESVYAVLEVKQKIGLTEIKYAGQKAASARILERTSAPIPYAAGIYPPKTPGYILSGVLGTESGWSPPFGSTFEKNLKILKKEERLDFGCIIDSGAFEASYSDNDLKLFESYKTSALIFFLFTLLKRLSELGTVSAIDITRYMHVLKLTKRK